MKQKKNIGIKVKEPKEKCEDKNCPFHGKMGVRGRMLVGTIIKRKVQKSPIFEMVRTRQIPKYERYEKRRTRLKVHNPPCINAEEGDIVKIAETRPISKTKSFVIIERIGYDVRFKQKQEALEEAKVGKEKEEETPEEEKEKGETEGE